jgi:hypothetical protein
MTLRTYLAALVVVASCLGVTGQADSAAPKTKKDTSANSYDEGSITKIAGDFFGDSSEALAKVIQKAFADLGRPNAYIAGQEVSGAMATSPTRPRAPARSIGRAPPPASISARMPPSPSRWSIISTSWTTSTTGSRASTAASITSPASA